MTEPSLALQTAIRARLLANAGVTGLVPAAHIFDRNGRPEAMPCILIGDGLTVFADNYDEYHDRVYSELHIWSQEPGLEGVKAIAGAVRAALPTCAWIVAGFTVPNVKVTNTRFIRDPDNLHSHAIVSVEAIMRAVA